MRKLRTFYGKVTEFLNDDKITCLQGLDVIVIIELYRRVGRAVYLYDKTGYLCRSLSGCGMHISSTELSDLRIKTGSSFIWSDVNRRFCPMLIQKHLKTPYIFSESTACLKFRQSLKQASSLRLYLNFKHWHDVPIGKYIQR